MKEYFRIFEDVLNSGQTKLLVLGYSFRDRHVNEILEKVIQKGAKIYVVDPSALSAMKTHMGGNGASKVWENMSGYFPYKMLDLFRHNGEPTAAWKQLLSSYFEVA